MPSTAGSSARGEPADVLVGAPAGASQAYEAYEHADLGNADGGSNIRIMTESGVSLTYGEMGRALRRLLPLARHVDDSARRRGERDPRGDAARAPARRAAEADACRPTNAMTMNKEYDSVAVACTSSRRMRTTRTSRTRS